MSNTIQPWIRTYLIHVAETYGGDLMSVPLEPKNKKVQAIEFLTPHAIGKDSWVWVVVSDKFHTIPARLSKQSIQEFEAHSIYGRNSLSGYKTGVLLIKEFRPMFTRVPGPHGMRQVPQLVLDVGVFTLQGCYGEAPYGKPQVVEKDENIREWSEGLKAEGGGGNVLKLRKLEREKASSSHERGGSSSREDIQRKVSLSILQTQQYKAPKPLPDDMRYAGGSDRASRPQKGTSKSAIRRQWNRDWRAAMRGADFPDFPDSTLARPVPAAAKKKRKADATNVPSKGEVQDLASVLTTPPRKRRPHALDMSTPHSSPSVSMRKSPASAARCGSPARKDVARPTTPSQWSPSVHGGSQLPSSPIPMEVYRDENPDDAEGGSPTLEDDFDIRSSRPSSPESADKAGAEADPATEQADANDVQPGLDAPVSPPIPFPTPAQRGRLRSLPLDLLTPSKSDSPPNTNVNPHASSLPAESPSFLLSQDLSEDASPQASQDRRAFRRPFTVPLISMGRILVPNSDSSQSHSQSQSQSAAFSSQLQHDSQDHQLVLTGPQQSLSYTSQSQSNSSQPHAKVQAPEDLQPENGPEAPPEVIQSFEVAEDVIAVDERQSSHPTPDPHLLPEDLMQVDEDEGNAPYDPAQSIHSPAKSETYVQEDAEVSVGLGVLHPPSSPPADQNDQEENVSDFENESLRANEESDDLENSSDEEEEDINVSDEEEKEEILAQDEEEAEARTDKTNQPHISTIEAEVDELDSDDARVEDKIRRSTAPTSNQRSSKRRYTSLDVATPRSPVLVQRRLSPDIFLTHNQAEGNDVHLQGPSKVVPTLPDAPDVTKGTLSTHDAEAWRQPSFLRSRGQAANQKRRASPVIDDNRPTKKSRISGPELPASGVDASLSVHTPDPGTSSAHSKRDAHYCSFQKVDSLQSTVSKIRHLDLSRSGSSSSSAAKTDPQNVKSLPKKDDSSSGADSATKAVRHIDLSTVVSSSTLNKGKGRAMSRTLESAAPASSHKPQTTSYRSADPDAGAEAGPSNGEILSSSRPTDKHALNAETEGDAQRRMSYNSRGKFGGYKLDLSMFQNDEGPPLVTWEVLTDILLRTGRARHKEQKREERPEGS